MSLPFTFEKKAVDFDSTLEFYDSAVELLEPGPPVPGMLERVKGWLAEGQPVVIFTARAGIPGQEHILHEWCEKYGLPKLEVTNVKDFTIGEIFDDI